MKNLYMFLIGGVGYVFIELLWRGYSHPSMIIAGGLSFLFIRKIYVYFYELSLFKKSLLSSFAITTVEMITGFFVNVLLNLSVWDYSNLPFNLSGQVSLLYTVLWFFLSGFIIKIFDLTEKLNWNL